MNYFDSDMSNSTNTVAQFDGKDGNLYLHLWARSHTIYAVQVGCSIFQPAKFKPDDNSSTCAFTTGKSVTYTFTMGKSVILMEHP